MFVKSGFVGEDVYVIYGDTPESVTLVLSSKGTDRTIDKISKSKAQAILDRIEIQWIKKANFKRS